MGSRNISIVDADIDTVAVAIRQFIKQKNFSCNEDNSREVSISAKNPCKSFFRLLFTGQPQIIIFTLAEASESRTRVKIEFKRFPNFAMRFYSILALLVIFSSFWTHFPGGGLLASAAVMSAYFLLAVYEARDGAAAFFYSLYRYLSDEMIGPITHLQTPLSSLRILAEIAGFSFFLIWVFCPGAAFLAKLTSSSALLLLFCFGSLLFSLFCALFVFQRNHPYASIRTMFLLPGLVLSCLLLLFLNLPLLSTAIFDSHAPIYACLIGLSIMLAMVLMVCFSQALMPLSIARLMSKYPPDVSGSLFFNVMAEKRGISQYRIIVLLLWLTILAGNVFGLYTAASAACGGLLGAEQILPSRVAEAFVRNVGRSAAGLFETDGAAYAKLFLLAYLLPIILFVLLMAFRFLRTLIYRASILFRWGKHKAEESKVAALLEPICSYARIRFPIVVIVDSGTDTNAKASFIGLPVCRNALMISLGTVRTLQEGKLIVLLAHEAGHMKQHTLMHTLQRSISELSFFGSGFLNALSNSFEIEYEADKFTVGYLRSQGTGSAALIDLLEMQKGEEDRACEVQLRMLLERGTLNFSMLFNRRYNAALLEISDKSSYIQRVILSSKLFRQMCFGGEVISYFHPPLEERIKRVKELSHA